MAKNIWYIKGLSWIGNSLSEKLENIEFSKSEYVSNMKVNVMKVIKIKILIDNISSSLSKSTLLL